MRHLLVTALLMVSFVTVSCQHASKTDIDNSALTPPADDAERTRFYIVQAERLLEEGFFHDAEQALEPALNSPHFRNEVSLLAREINQAKRFANLKKAQDLSARIALTEAEQRVVLPEHYGTVRVVSADLEPLVAPEGPMEELLKRHVDMSLYDADVRTMVMALSEIDGLNIIADDALTSDRSVTVSGKNMPLKEVLSYISRTMGVAFHLGENIIWVTAAETTADGPQLETRIFQLRHGYIPAGGSRGDSDDYDSTTTNTVSTSGATSGGQDDLLTVLSEFVLDSADRPADAKLEMYRNRNLLVMRDTRQNLRAAEALIAMFDEAPLQVVIEARFVTIGQEDLFQLGVDIEEILHEEFDTNEATGLNDVPELILNAKSILPPFSGDSPGGDTSISLSGTIDKVTYKAVLRAVEQAKSSKVISAPRVTVLNNQTASIRRGGTINYYERFDSQTTITDEETVSTLVPEGSPTQLETGLSLNVLPSIGSDRKSTVLSLAAENSEFLGFDTFETTNTEIRLPKTEETTIDTKVVVNSGETVVMGGMVETQHLETTSHVPFLGKLPLIGSLFTSHDNASQPSHLLIFVTATIVDPDGAYNVAPETGGTRR